MTFQTKSFSQAKGKLARNPNYSNPTPQPGVIQGLGGVAASAILSEDIDGSPFMSETDEVITDES